jgi:hypothetical protein
MRAEFSEVTLETLGSGVVSELFAVEFRKILDNIDDPNTDPTIIRRLTIEIAVKPSKDRSNAAFAVTAKTKTASPEAHVGVVHLSRVGSFLRAYTTDPAPVLPGFEARTNIIPLEGGPNA